MTGRPPKIRLHAADIAASYRAGASLRALAARYGSDPKTVMRELDRAGIARRPQAIGLAMRRGRPRRLDADLAPADLLAYRKARVVMGLAAAREAFGLPARQYQRRVA